MTTPQPPKTDFLALTHGQEWVTFYESFDKLVQDHLSRSSDLLRRAMSLPEVADREVAQVRDELEGRLSAERDRTSSVLTDLKTQIGNSHRLASTLAMSIGSLMTDLHSLTIRVDEALKASAAPATTPPAAPSAPIAPTGLLSSTPPSAPSPSALSGTSSAVAPGTGSLNGTPGTGSLNAAPGTGSLAGTPDAAPLGGTDLLAASDASTVESDLSPEPVDVAGIADLDAAPTPDVADLAEAIDAGDETPIDLSAIAEAEASSDAPATTEPAAGVSEATTDGGEGAPSPETGERQRPHWLSVTRVGASRP